MRFPDNDQLMVFAEVTDDDRYVVATLVEGTENRNRLWVYPIADRTDGRQPARTRSRWSTSRSPSSRWCGPPGRSSTCGPTWTPSAAGWSASTSMRLGRSRLPRASVEVVGESEHTLMAVEAAGEAFLALYLADAQPLVRRFSLDGTELGEVDVPGGAVVAVDGEPGIPSASSACPRSPRPTLSYRIEHRHR